MGGPARCVATWRGRAVAVAGHAAGCARVTVAAAVVAVVHFRQACSAVVLPPLASPGPGQPWLTGRLPACLAAQARCGC